jgi:DNA-binding MarR family transcriptional regulator
MDSLPAAPFATDVEPPPQRTFGFRLWAVKHAWTRRLEAVLEPTGLTHMQYIIMRCIGHVAAEGALPSQVRIAETMGIDRMTVSKVVRTLEAKGLLARRPHPDDPAPIWWC